MIILVWAECPYILFRAARVTSTEFVVGGYKLAREGGSSQVSVGKNERVRELGRCSAMCLRFDADALDLMWCGEPMLSDALV